MKRATLVLAALALLAGGPRPAQAGMIFSENFDDINSGSFGSQYQTGLTVTALANLPGWNSSGFHAVHGVQVTPGDWAAQIYGDNALTLANGFAGNDLGVTYQVTFDSGATVWENPAQATGASDALLIQLLDPSNTVVSSYSYAPGAWAGAQTLNHVSFAYAGTGTGAVRFRIASAVPRDAFAGAIDNLQVSAPDASPAPEPSSLALLGTAALTGLGLFGWRRWRPATAAA